IAMNSTMDPTILVGGELPLINGNFRIGNSDLFITEACEYKGSFLKFPAQTALILNVEADHLDYYRDLQHVLDTFKSYITLVPKDGTVVANADDPHMDYILEGAEPRVITFGIKKGDLRAKDISYDAKGRGSFKAYLDNEFLVDVTLSVPGEFNILNALGAIGASLAAGIPLESIRKGLDTFSGVNKRFQLLFTEKEITVIDDYAHHPGEIKASLDTAERMDFNHLHVVFQPHTYTRTKSLFGEFAESFDRVDNLVLLDIYAAREPDTGLVTSEELGDAIRERNTVNVVNMHTFEDAADYLMGVLEPNDIVITMGAGESVRVAELLKNRLKQA
ncbi:MAG TPA: Mur ligase family protein, partial [Clostridiaceae bacterium]|nr:Mur ligase family protein [Clostridiaceae bacterium]